MRPSFVRLLLLVASACWASGLTLACGDPDVVSHDERVAEAVSMACPALVGPIQPGLTRTYEATDRLDGSASTSIAVVTSVQADPEKVVFVEEQHTDGRLQSRSTWRCEGGAAYLDHATYTAADGAQWQRVVVGPMLPADLSTGDSWDLKFTDTDAEGVERTVVWHHWVNTAQEEATPFGRRWVVLIVAGGDGGAPGGGTSWAEGLGRLNTWLIQATALVDLQVVDLAGRGPE